MVNGCNIYPARSTYLSDHYKSAPVLVKKKSTGEFKVFGFESGALNYARFINRTKILNLDTLLNMAKDPNTKFIVEKICKQEAVSCKSAINWVEAIRLGCQTNNVAATKEFKLAQFICNKVKEEEVAPKEETVVEVKEEPKAEAESEEPEVTAEHESVAEKVTAEPVAEEVTAEPVVEEPVKEEAQVETVEEPEVPVEENSDTAAEEPADENTSSDESPKTKKRNRKR